MSVLNLSSDGMANVLLVLYKYVLQQGTVAESALLDICAPNPPCSQDRIRTTLNTWTELGLFERTDKGVRLSKDLPASARDKDQGISSLGSTLRELVFRSENNPDFWASEKARAADFTRALTWCLAMDPFRLHGLSFDEDEGIDYLQGRTLPSRFDAFQNDTRWNGFRVWSTLLGFAWYSRYPKKRSLVIDPSQAIRESLPPLFGEEAELTEKEFLHRLRAALPVLDGGEYRQELESQLQPGTWTEPKTGQLSRSLSLALYQLDRERRLQLDDRADADGKARLVGRGESVLKSFTHVRYLGDAR